MPVKRYFQSFVLSAIGILLFFFCFFMTGIPDWKCLGNFQPFWAALILLAQGCITIIVTLRWRLMSSVAGIRFPFLPAFKITAYSFFAASVVPQGLADLAGRGPWAAKYTDCGILNATNVILCDRLLDVYVIGLLIPPAILVISETTETRVALWIAAGLLVLGYFCICFTGGKIFLIFQFAFNIIRVVMKKFNFLTNRFNWQISLIMPDWREFSLVYALSVLKFLLLVFVTLLYFKVVHLDVPFPLVFFAMPVTQFIFIFAFTPGGLGIMELGWISVLGIHGFSPDSTSLFILSQRVYFTLSTFFWTLIFFCMPGISLFPHGSASEKTKKLE